MNPYRFVHACFNVLVKNTIFTSFPNGIVRGSFVTNQPILEMSIAVKLLVGSNGIELNSINIDFSRSIDSKSRPSDETMGGNVTLSYTPLGEEDFILEWMLSNRKDDDSLEHNKSTYKIKDAEVVFFEENTDGRVLYKYTLNDCVCIDFHETFDLNTGMQTRIVLSSAILHYKDLPAYVKSWNETWQPPSEEVNQVVVATEPEDEKPSITAIDWIDKDKTVITETGYNTKVGLKITIENPDGGNVNVLLKKKDGTAFEGTKKEISINRPVAGGTVFFEDIKVLNKWENFDSPDITELVVTATYKESTKESKSIEISPTPKVLVSFRPNDTWKGEFGFDWIRTNDTSLFNDEKFEDIVSKQYTDASHTTLEPNGNKYKGVFKKDEALLKDLKKKYEPFEITWRTVLDDANNKVQDKHHTEWLSLLKGKEAKVKIHLDVTEEADYLEFDDNANFTISPKKIDISGKTGIKKLADLVSVKCDAEFLADQELVVKAFKEGQDEGVVAGKINVWANDSTKHKQKKVVFVQIKTPAMSSRVKQTANATNEKARINKYLEQGYIELHPDSTIVDIDVSADPDFSRFIKNNSIMKTGDAVPAVAAVPGTPEVIAVAATPAVPATATTPAIPAKPAVPGKAAVPGTPAKAAIPRQKLVDYIKEQLKALDAKYDGADFFKAIYFAEHGYHSSGGRLSGYSASGSDYVVVFKSANDQTASHEFLHAFDLAHTFTNSEASANAEFTYEAKETDNLLDYSHNISSDPNNNNRCSLYYWQWIRANNSI